jgi:Xaa-Pro aminopeptidase
VIEGPGDGIPAATVLRSRAMRSAAKAPSKTTRSPSKAKKPDPATPEALLRFMMTDWAPGRGALPAPLPHAAAFHARRRALSKRFPAETLVVPTGHEKVRANDTHFRFRPGSDFFYLTGNHEPDCVLVLEPKAGGGHRDILFVEPNPGRSDPTFFTDRNKGELWVGARLGVPESKAHFGVHECRSLKELPAYLGSLTGRATRPRRVLRGFSEGVDAALPKSDRDAELAQVLSEIRLVKDGLEIEELKKVVASTKRGFEDVVRSLRRGPLAPAGKPQGARTEREIEGVFYLRARAEGNDVGYGTIAASGANACILHWTRNDARLRKGELLLLDAGVEGTQLYTADVTRTVPISGKFSREQREVYELVLAAQRAALGAVRPGNDFMEPNRAAMRVLAEGLVAMGILRCTVEEALAPDQLLHRRYTLHNVSHMLGLDVHDCAKARQEVYRFGKLRPGMVLTVEPGLYFQEGDLTVPERYRGIGVRIEDDVLVTATGMKNLSAAIPTGATEIERWMADLWARG